MFEGVTAPYREPFQKRSLAMAIGVHAVALGVVLWSANRIREVAAPPVPVVLFKAPPPRALPPPPPPPAKTSRPRTEPKTRKPDPLVAPTRIPDKLPEPTKVAAVEAPASTSEPQAGGQVGGVEGGVAGGVVGGVVGEPLGLPQKPKNVPAFVIARDLLQQTAPSLPEVFKRAHRGEQLAGMYRVCVDTSGKVYQVSVIKSVPGADEAIISAVQEGWLYKPQAVPVCFLYNMPITIQ